jgi:DNA-binding transcriptional LysR family regulator
MKLIEIPCASLASTEDDTPTAVARNARAYDGQNARITLRQWRMLHAVIDHDGFTAAAECLHVSQSAISYTIGKLQEQLGIALIRFEGRKPHLTQHGRALIERSRGIIRAAIELETFAENLRLGWEEELRLMVDQDCPRRFLMSALREFNASAPKVRVLLSEGSSDQVQNAARDEIVDLAICSQLPTGSIGNKLMTVEYLAVAHPMHPICRPEMEIGTSDLARHVQIVIGPVPDSQMRSRHEPAKQQHAGKWHVSSLDTALAALAECLGYAWLPKEQVQKLIDQGKLCKLNISKTCNDIKNFYLMRSYHEGLGNGAENLSKLLYLHADQYFSSPEHA